MTKSLIEIYIQEVTRRLPERSREDIGLELRSTIEDMLPDDYSEEDVKKVLEKLGNPAMLAGNYLDRPMHLIGPRYCDVYITLLKMVLPIAAVISLITTIAEFFIQYNGEEAVMNVVIDMIGFSIWKVIATGIQTFFWFTFVFAIIERTDKGKDQQPLTTSLKKWTPEDLKNIPNIPKNRAISKIEVFGSFMWIAIWATFYFYADHLVGVYEGNGDGLTFVAPTFQQDVLFHYLPAVVAIIGLETALTLYKFVKGQWTNKVAIFNTIVELAATGIFIFIFSHPNLLNQEFVAYMSDLFSISGDYFKVWFISGIIATFVIFQH